MLQVNLYCDCPLWPEDGMCAQRSCSVCECEPNEVPQPWLQAEKQSCEAEPVEEPCSHEECKHLHWLLDSSLMQHGMARGATGSWQWRCLKWGGFAVYGHACTADPGGPERCTQCTYWACCCHVSLQQGGVRCGCNSMLPAAQVQFRRSQ